MAKLIHEFSSGLNDDIHRDEKDEGSQQIMESYETLMVSSIISSLKSTVGNRHSIALNIGKISTV